MSMQSSIVYGFGFEIEEITDENLFNFIEKYKEILCKSEEERQLFDGVTIRSDLKNYLDDYPCDCSGHEGFGAVVSNAISRETGIRIEYQMGQFDCYSFPTVLFSQSMPWGLNDKEKELTEESLTEILIPYAEELGLEERDVGYVEVEYYG